ncbi:ATP-grasp domain-containing protein [bacterium]|nr:ATP-grasp domain-containing protein [bacterium]
MIKILNITKKAGNQLINIAKYNNTNELLFYVKGGGCNGFNYKLKPITKENPHDPDKLDEKVIKEIQGIAIKTFKALDLSGMARVDFFLTKDNKVILNEVNTIPGFTKISMYSKLWQASGLEYSDLLDELITLAIDRNKAKNELNTSYKPKTDWYK